MASLVKHRLSGFFVFLFLCLLFTQILYSERPTEIDFTVIWHVGTLVIFLFFGLCYTLTHPDYFSWDRLTMVALVFAGYFYTVGVFIALMNGVKFMPAIEYPYRMCNIFILLFIPLFIRSEKSLNQVFAMMLVMMGLQILRDMFVGSETLLTQRLWSSEFVSIMFMGALPFVFGGVILYWNDKKWRAVKRILLVLLCLIVLLKWFLTFARAIWLVIFPANIVGVLYLLHRKARDGGNLAQWCKKISKFVFVMIAAGFIMIVLIAIFNPDTSDLILKRYDLTDQQAGYRMGEYLTAINDWLASPIWGNGFGFETTTIKGQRVKDQDYIHNFVLQFLFSSGIIGLALVLCLLLAPLIQLMRLFNRTQSLVQTAVLISCLLTMMNLILLSSVQTAILRQETYFLLAMIVSFAIIIKRLQREEMMQSVYPAGARGAPVGWGLGIPLKLRGTMGFK